MWLYGLLFLGLTCLFGFLAFIARSLAVRWHQQVHSCGDDCPVIEEIYSDPFQSELF